MKHKHIFSLLDKTFTTVRVAFDNDAASYYAQQPAKAAKAPPPPGMAPAWEAPETFPGMTYVYKVPLDWHATKGQQALVERSGRISVVTIMEVHDTPDIDVDADHDYKWLVQLVDLSAYDELVEREKQFGKAMLEVERTKQREELVNSFRSTLAPGSAALALFEQTASSLTIDMPAPVTPPSAPSATARSYFGEDNTADEQRSFGDGPAHADDGHAGFTPPPRGDK